MNLLVFIKAGLGMEYKVCAVNVQFCRIEAENKTKKKISFECSFLIGRGTNTVPLESLHNSQLREGVVCYPVKLFQPAKRAGGKRRKSYS